MSKNAARNVDQELNRHYVHQIKKMPILTIDEEYKLAKKWRDEGDQEAVKRLVNSHLRLVTKIASGYRGYGLPLSELVAEGNIGMMQALKHYDPERGFRLSTYAMWWIKAAIQEYILHSWSLVKIGTTAAQKKLFFNLRKVKQELQGLEEDLHPDIIKKIAEKLDVSEEEVRQMNTRIAGPDHSLNAPIRTDSEGESEWLEWIADERDNQEIHLVHHDELMKRRQLLENAMACLNHREHQIFVERRLSEPPHTLENISERLQISRERVRQIEVKAFEKIQKAIKRLSTASQHNI
jgi:RNA polymerase sigma-32 factor